MEIVILLHTASGVKHTLLSLAKYNMYHLNAVIRVACQVKRFTHTLGVLESRVQCHSMGDEHQEYTFGKSHVYPGVVEHFMYHSELPS